jgi:hypothetical protein
MNVDHAGQLVEGLRRHGRRTLPLEVVQHEFAQLFPSLAASLDARQHLLDLLQEAEDRAWLRCQHSFDDFSLPPLPLKVVLAAPAAPPRRRSRSLPMVPELEWAAGLQMDDDEVRFLTSVNIFLRDLTVDEPVIPVRERSLEITGEEKAVQRFAAGRLFRKGRLSLDLLRCEPTFPPLAYHQVGPAPTMLVVENQDTHWSLRRLLRPVHGIGLVAYGVGNQIPASIRSVLELPQRLESIQHFGDVDVRGLQIPISARTVAIHLQLPPVEPAAWLYRLLFEISAPGPGTEQIDCSDQIRRLTRWLPPDLRDRATWILGSGGRLAQEAVGHKVLVRYLQARQQPMQ